MHRSQGGANAPLCKKRNPVNQWIAGFLLGFYVRGGGGQMKVCRTIGGHGYLRANTKSFAPATLQNHTHFRPWLHLLFFGHVR